METNLTKIMNFMKGKEKVHINEIVVGTSILKSSVRWILRKEKKHFEIVNRGNYKLKDGAN